MATDTVMLYGCERLVGAQRYVPGNSDGVEELTHGTGSVITDPAADARSWYWGHLYSNGEPAVTASSVPDAPRAMVASGHFCAQGRYERIGCMPWGDERGSVVKATFAANLAAFAYVSLSFLFHSFSTLGEVVGMANLPGRREMRRSFASCGALEELDLSDFDVSQCEDLFYCFSGSDLVKIWTDADFVYLDGRASSGVSYSLFCSCDALVGSTGRRAPSTGGVSSTSASTGAS